MTNIQTSPTVRSVPAEYSTGKCSSRAGKAQVLMCNDKPVLSTAAVELMMAGKDTPAARRRC